MEEIEQVESSITFIGKTELIMPESKNNKPKIIKINN